MEKFYNKSKGQVNGNHYLRMAFLIIAGLFIMVGQLSAQDGCYGKNRKRGIEAMNKKEYDKAIGCFETAKSCPDKPSSNDLDAKIKECRQKKQQMEKDKKDALEKKKKEAELKRQAELEQQMQDELDRMAWEAELERLREEEERMAAKGYMDITSIDFLNSNELGYALSQPGTVLYDDDVQFIQPNVTYDGLSDEPNEVTLYMKFIKPNGELLSVANAPEGFSMTQTVTVYPGKNNTLVLTGLGSKTNRYYPQGNYRFELWCQGNRIYSSSFTTVKTPPKTVVVNLSVANNAAIYVNGRYKANGSYRESLPFGSYTIVCTKESHRQTTTTIVLSEGMPEQTIQLEEPTPMYGSVIVRSKPKSAVLYVDGKMKGQTPTTCDRLLVGEHTIKLEKKGYSAYETKVSIEEGKMLYREYKMNKLPYRYNFASFFLDGVVGNVGNTDELMLGGNMTICPRYVGVYGQYLRGLSNSSRLTTGGLVFRLTRDYVDLQLITGIGSGKVLQDSYELDASSYYKKGVVYDIGGRIGWRTSLNWGMFDLMGGCVFDKDGDKYPYVGVGTGFSIIAGIIALKTLK